MTDPSPALDAAVPLCPQHPGEAAPLTCARCGRFLCELCRRGTDVVHCGPCEAAATDVLGLRARAPSMRGFFEGGTALLTASLKTVAPIWFVALAGQTLLYVFVLEQTGRKEDAEVASKLADAFLRTWASGASLSALLAVARGSPLSPLAAWGAGLGLFARMFVTSIRFSLNVIGYALLLVVPGIMRAASLSLAFASAADQRAFDPLRISEDRTRGRRRAVGLALLTAYLGYFALSAMLGAASSLLADNGVPSLLLVLLVSALPAVMQSFIDALSVAAYLSLEGAASAEDGTLQAAA